MKFDQEQELKAIQRRVVRDDIAETVSVIVSRIFDGDQASTWDALTNAELLPRWFIPISGDLREGGKFELDGNASGEILLCEKPVRFEVTFGSPDSIVDVRIAEQAGKTTVELTHTVPLATAQSGAGALFVGPGWDGGLLGLGLFLAGEEIGNPVEAANSPEVIAFNRASIDHWTTSIEESDTATADEIAALREIAISQYTVAPE